MEARERFEEKAGELAELLALDGKGAEDGFTPWFRKCKEQLQGDA